MYSNYVLWNDSFDRIPLENALIVISLMKAMKMKFYIPPDKREQDSDIFSYDNKNDNNKRLRTEQ